MFRRLSWFPKLPLRRLIATAPCCAVFGPGGGPDDDVAWAGLRARAANDNLRRGGSA
jgi:hypothetical protein